MPMEQDERIRIDLMTPLRADFISDEQLESDEEWDEQMGFPLDGADLAQYKDSIQEMVDRYNASGSENGEPCNLMQYFHGSASIADKVESAVVSVKESEGVLYGCTTLQLKELLEMNELTELCKYITGQYSDGWGEGFEQCDIKVEDGTINVHFWQNGNFRFQEAPAQESQIPAEVSEKTVSRPKLKLLGHDGNIFSILGDARRLLRANGQRKEADEMTQRVENSGDYYKALGIISEYVETELSQNTSAKPQKSGETKKSVKENRER
jgi:hypothetical protein